MERKRRKGEGENGVMKEKTFESRNRPFTEYDFDKYFKQSSEKHNFTFYLLI